MIHFISNQKKKKTHQNSENRYGGWVCVCWGVGGLGFVGDVLCGWTSASSNLPISHKA